ncbi:hypothetical protein [Phenylobacterium sp.]|uniref:SRPBCC family protein n=1 Tax=Phenylobacterium sp. TaxID=1871053 RepID=UPI00286A5488|nr:hypothetical protein [Phenylobacterium sp.]
MTDAPDTPGKALVELAIAVPAREVWNALRDPVQINRWFGWDADGLEAEIQYIFFDHAQADDSAMILSFSGMPDSFQIEARGEHCVIRLVRVGAAGDDSDWDGGQEDMTEGWLAFLTQLAFAMERHRGQERRTVYLSGKPAPGGNTTLPRARLGLDALAHVDPGGDYSLTIGTGETLTGQVWARSRRQIALTVEAYGDGLVLVTDRSTPNSPPAGSGSVVVTTYDLDDARFAEVSAHWTEWWRQHFPPPAT